jgi:transcriptional regulator with XRE-family HTH domain
MDQQKIGAFLRQLRIEQGFTQEELADKLNVTSRSISRWETGKNLPDITLLVQLAELFDVEISEIINGERKNRKMNDKEKDAAEKSLHYSETDKEDSIKQNHNHRLPRAAFITVLAGVSVFAFVLIFTHGSKQTVSVLLDDGADAEKVKESISNVNGVSDTAYYSKDIEMKYFLDNDAGSLREDYEYMLSVEGNPLKDRVEVTVRGNMDLSDVTSAISSIDGVAEVLPVAD